MRRSVWLFLIWLLSLALPAQGLAAAAMLHCPHARAVTAAPATHHQHSGHDGATAQGHTVHATLSDPTAPDEASGSGSHVGAAAKACSACAACCMGLALPSAGAFTPQPPLVVGTALPAPADPAAAFFTSGPDRPPRSHAA